MIDEAALGPVRIAWTLAADDADLLDAVRLLGPSQRMRHDGMDAPRARRFATGRRLLATLVPEAASGAGFIESVCDQCGGDHGRPREFDFSLTRTRWFGDRILWLAPANPSPFIELTDAVVGAFPDYPPYGGAHDGSAPHATVGDSGDHVALLRAERAVSPLLPISGVVAAVTLIVEDADGQWREHIHMPLTKRG